MGSDPMNEPVTSRSIEVATPPAFVFRHASATLEPFTVARRFAGADGAASWLMNTRISLDGPLVPAAVTVRART